jgi:hypothetical protein
MAETTNSIGSGTVAGALQYLDFLSSKGHVKPGAIAALKTGFSKVMKTVGDQGWENIEIRNIDIDNYMNRFANMTQGQYNSNSLTDYRSRVNKVTSWYLEFLSKPGWTPDVKERKRKSSTTRPIGPAGHEVDAAAGELSNDNILSTEMVATPPSKANLVAFPFPLSDGTLATLYLPPIIAPNDARRMARFVETLVIQESADNGAQ